MCDCSFFVFCSDFASLKESEAELNGQLGMNVAEQEFGICPIMTGKEMSTLEESDSLCMVLYLSQLHELLKDTTPPSGEYNPLCLLFFLYFDFVYQQQKHLFV